MMPNTYPEIHLALHRCRLEEVTRVAAHAMRYVDRRMSLAVRLGRAIVAAFRAGAGAFAETVTAATRAEARAEARAEERGGVR
jgi:hypothetical protein